MSEVRLIDANELKKAFEKVYPLATNEMGGVVNKPIYEIIDNAPTVEPTFGLFKEMLCAECGKRPKGKWICEDALHCLYYCSECRNNGEHIQPFCAWCGAEMEKGGAE